MKRITVTTSWDDGDLLDLKLVKLLNKHNIKGTFYIPGNTKLNKSQIKEISNSHEIGAHTMTHRELPSISLKEAEEEICNSKKFIEKIINKRIVSFCYPRGKYNKDIVFIVKRCGFKYARTTERFHFDVKNPLLAGTTCQTITFKIDLLNMLKLNNFNPFTIKYLYNIEDNIKIIFKYLNNKKGGILHLWGHSWEIEKYNQWNSLEKAFKFLASQKNVVFKINGDLIAK